MDVALLVGFILLVILSVAASSLIYSHYIYSKNRVFSKTKYSVLWIIFCAVLFIFMLIAGIFFSIDLNKWHTFRFDAAYVGLSFTIMVLSIAYMICFLLIPKLTNKNKISYDQMLNVDYASKVKALEAKIGSEQALKDYLNKKHNKYYQAMLSYYESILNRAKNLQISQTEKMADIVTFNDAFTHKWCSKTNDYQLLLTFRFCAIFQKNS